MIKPSIRARRKVKIGEILISQNHITQDQLEIALNEQKKCGENLGTILVRLKYIDEATLHAVLGKQIEISQHRRIGEILIENEYITNEQLETALKEQKYLGLKIGKVLIRLGYIDESILLDALAAQLDVQHVVLDNFSFNPEIIRLIPEEMARTYNAIPLYKHKNVLTIATSDPTNLRSLDHIKFKTGMTVEPVIATEQEILSAIDRTYVESTEALAQLLGSEEGDDLDVVEHKEEEEIILQDQEGQQVIKIVNLIVAEAIRQGASDIHLEPQENHLRLRYRIDGSLTEKNPIPKTLMNQVVSRLKILSGMDIAERRRPLDGRFTIRQKGKEVDLRVSTFPTMLRGRGVLEKMVIRILSFDVNKVDLKKTGFSKAIYNKFVKLIQVPNGIVLVTGPTGSGKSSTLYSCIKHVMDSEVNIVTMEDPVEMNLPGVSQGQINPKAGFTFASGMRAILRQDPDIIMLGEMRDEETARMAIQSALTGHLVFSTLHTNDAAEAFNRMLDMGIEPYLLTACIRGVLAQRLVRCICTKCRQEFIPGEEVLQSIGIRSRTKFYQGKGCSFCNNTGYKGRMGIFELLIPDNKVNKMIYKGESSDAIKEYAINTLKMATLRRDGLEKALAGLTTLEQVIAVS
jgi:type IV pilus assembly protein PilB